MLHTTRNEGCTRQCPTCNAELRLADREGIEIDYCPQCRGVWLDRGELDKIVERQAAMMSPAPRGGHQAEYRPEYEHRRREDDDRFGDDHDRRRKRSDWFSEPFD